MCIMTATVQYKRRKIIWIKGASWWLVKPGIIETQLGVHWRGCDSDNQRHGGKSRTMMNETEWNENGRETEKWEGAESAQKNKEWCVRKKKKKEASRKWEEWSSGRWERRGREEKEEEIEWRDCREITPPRWPAELLLISLCVPSLLFVTVTFLRLPPPALPPDFHPSLPPFSPRYLSFPGANSCVPQIVRRLFMLSFDFFFFFICNCHVREWIFKYPRVERN